MPEPAPGEVRIKVKQAAICGTDLHIEAWDDWAAANVTPGGALHINDGAAEALRKGGSLLPVGVTSCEGTFERGDAVEIRHNGTAIATGLASYGADAATLIAGRRSAETETILGYTYGDELVHRDNLVLRG